MLAHRLDERRCVFKASGMSERGFLCAALSLVFTRTGLPFLPTVAYGSSKLSVSIDHQ